MIALFNKIVCPFCFQEVERGSIEYRCVNKRCPSAAEPDHLYSQYMRWPRDQGLGHVFKPTSRSLFGRSSDVSCDVCHDHTPKPICPHCHNPLPESTLTGTDNIISVVGTRGSGKSHYIAVLIDELRKRVGHSMGAEIRNFVSLGSGGYDVESLYQETKYRPLYEDQKLLELTRSDVSGVRENDKIPLIYIWNYLDHSFGRKKSFTLSFFDAAGEDLQNEEDIATVGGYLRHSKGIIFLADPLQIPSVRAQLEAETGGALTSLAGVESTKTFSSVLANVTTLIRNARGIKQGAAIDIPVAVTFPKFDALLPIASDALTIQQPSPHCAHGAFVEGDQQAVDAEMRTLLENWGEGALITDIRGNFKDVSFFAVSSLGLGNAPDTDGNVRRPRPHRVEDPLLWLMSRYGLVTKEQ